MRQRSSSATPHNTPAAPDASSPRPRRRLPVVLLLITAVLAVGLVAERQDTALPAESAASRSKAAKASQSFFKAKKSKAVSASSFNRRSRAHRAPKASATPPAGNLSSPEGLQARARAITDNFGKGKISKATATVQANEVVRVAPQFFHTGPTGFICTLLLALLAAFSASPFFAFVVAALTPFLVAFGCPVPSSA